MDPMYVKPLPGGDFLCTISGKDYKYTANQVLRSFRRKILVTNVGPAPVKPFSL